MQHHSLSAAPSHPKIDRMSSSSSLDMEDENAESRSVLRELRDVEDMVLVLLLCEDDFL